MSKNLVEHLLYAEKVANFSKDSSTKVGAVFYDEENIAPISFGYNGMPRGLDDKDPIKTTRPEKYDWFEHAERNGLYNAAQTLMKDSIMFTSNFPNMESARAIVSSGIEEVVFLKNEMKDYDQRVFEMFDTCGVKYMELDMEKKYSGKLLKYQQYLDLANDYGITDSHEIVDEPTGVLILNKKTFSPIAFGATRPPTNIKINEKEFTTEKSHMWIQEAEKDAIFNALRPKFTNSKAYVNWCPCSRCSLALISVGVKTIVTKEPDFTKENDKRWQADFERTLSLLKTLSIELVLIPENIIQEQLNKTNSIKYKKMKLR